MPNWCYSRYAIYAKEGGEQQLRNLYMRIQSIRDEKLSPFDPKYLKDEGISSGWLGLLLMANGVEKGDVTEECRGFLSSTIDWETKPVNHITFSSDDAWGPKYEVINQLLDLPQYNKLAYEYIAEECGNEVWVNTDKKTKRFFPEEFHMDYEFLGHCDEGYFNNIRELVDYFNIHIVMAVQADYPEFKPKIMLTHSSNFNDVLAAQDEVEDFLTEQGIEVFMSINEYDC